MEILSVYRHDTTNVTVRVKSKDKTYEVDAAYSFEDKKWVAYLCRCAGFTQWMRCKHVKLVTEYLENYPKPASNEMAPIIEGYWYRCGYCNSIQFMILPPRGFRSYHAMVCLKCGKLYHI